jgi:hypothetical protein
MQIASKTARLKVFFSDWSGLPFVLGPTLITMVNLSLYAIKAVVLLDAEGNRVLSKYYGKEYVSTKDQKAFEKGLFDKTKRAQGKETRLHMSSIVLSSFPNSLSAGCRVLQMRTDSALPQYNLPFSFAIR